MTPTLEPNFDPSAVADRLRAGALVIYPTETLAGIGCDPCHEAALARLSQVKGRPAGQPYPLLVPDVVAADALALFPPAALRLAARFWPGLLTLVLPARAGVPASWTGADGTLALRISGHPVAAPLVRALGGPLVSTSANRSKEPPPTRVADVDPELRAAVELVLPDGPTPPAGTGSTLVRVAPDGGWEVLREGAIPAATIAATLSAVGAGEPPGSDRGDPA